VANLAGQIVEIVEGLDLPARRVVPLQIVSRLGHEKAAATGNLENSCLDLTASRKPHAIQNPLGVPEIQTDHGFSYDPRNLIPGNRAARPSVAEAGNLYPLFPEPIDPCRTVAVAGPDERNRIATVPGRQRFLERCAGGSPLGQVEIVQTVLPSLLQGRGVRCGVEIEMGSNQAGELPVFPGIIGRPVDDRRTAHFPCDFDRLHPQFVMHEDAEDYLRLFPLDFR